ncbi:MBL fold metallo-hydrolase [Vulgatibacter incomptus]|nr:MBL fold metallo-hydrolase [Vulgatibacter incomptus]
MDKPIVAWATVGPFRQNSYVLGDPVTKDAVLVDPGDEPKAIEAVLEREGLTPRFILNTHAHIDHVGAVHHFQQKWKLPFYLHPGDRDWLEALPLQGRMFDVPTSPIPHVDRWIADGETIAFGGKRIEVIHTPGHTPGGCCLLLRDDGILFTGDTIFAGSIGRTDFPGGSLEELLASIREKLFPLGDEVTFYSGHGPPSTLGKERRDNPFVGENATGSGRGKKYV